MTSAAEVPSAIARSIAMLDLPKTSLANVASLIGIRIAVSSCDTAVEVHKIHQQRANIVAMLVEAGFRPANSWDWFDKGDGPQRRDSGETRSEFTKPG